jgi:hypothetical protein
MDNRELDEILLAQNLVPGTGLGPLGIGLLPNPCRSRQRALVRHPACRPVYNPRFARIANGYTPSLQVLFRVREVLYFDFQFSIFKNFRSCGNFVVPGTGLEPAHLTALASKTSVSAIPPPGL